MAASSRECTALNTSNARDQRTVRSICCLLSLPYEMIMWPRSHEREPEATESQILAARSDIGQTFHKRINLQHYSTGSPEYGGKKNCTLTKHLHLSRSINKIKLKWWKPEINYPSKGNVLESTIYGTITRMVRLSENPTIINLIFY